MSRSRYAVLPLVLGLFAGTACDSTIGGPEPCLHSEGCDTGGGMGGGWNFGFPLSFNGLVTSATTGEPLAGVTVRIEAPVRAWSDTVVTDSAGLYRTHELSSPKAGDCAGLSVSFSKEGYQPLQVTDFSQLTCGGYPQLNASLTPTS